MSRWLPTPNRRAAAALAMAGALAAGVVHVPAQAAVSVKRVLDQATAMPGQALNFVYLASPTYLSGDQLFVYGWGPFNSGYGGIYAVPAEGGNPALLVDTLHTVPRTGGLFTGFSGGSGCDNPVADSQFVYFGAQNGTGLYRVPRTGGPVRRVADTTTPLPGGPVGGRATIEAFCRLAPLSRGIVFDSGGGVESRGIYRSNPTGSSIGRLANANTPYPPCGSAYGGCLDFQHPASDGSRAAWSVGSVFGVAALVHEEAGEVVSGSQVQPSGQGRYLNPKRQSITRTRSVFQAATWDGPPNLGLYSVNLATKAAVTVIDLKRPVPGRADARWTDFPQWQALNGRATLFNGSTCPVDALGTCTEGPRSGIYLACGREVVPVLLDGAAVPGGVMNLGIQSLGRGELQVQGTATVLRFPVVSDRPWPNAYGVAAYVVTVSDLPRCF